MQEYVYSVHRVLIEINLRIEHVLSMLTYIVHGNKIDLKMKKITQKNLS